MSTVSTVEQLQAEARAADLLYVRSRKILVDAVRAGIKAGLSQRDIAEAVGRSQPEVSRLVRFHGQTPLGKNFATTAVRSSRLRSLMGLGTSKSSEV